MTEQEAVQTARYLRNHGYQVSVLLREHGYNQDSNQVATVKAIDEVTGKETIIESLNQAERMAEWRDDEVMATARTLVTLRQHNVDAKFENGNVMALEVWSDGFEQWVTIEPTVRAARIFIGY